MIDFPRYLPICRIISTTPWIRLARSIRSRVMSLQREKSSSSLGDILTSERFLLDHLQIIRDDTVIGILRATQVRLEAMVEGLGAERDRGQRVIDLVRNARGEEADPRQPFGADELTAALLDLTLQVGVGHAELGRHVVEGLAKVLHLVARLQVDLVVEGAARRVAPRAEASAPA